MPKITLLSPTPDLKYAYSRLATPLYKTNNASVKWNGRLLSPRRKLKVTTKSLLPALSATWSELDTNARIAWKLAGAAQGYNAWNMFVQDTSYRMKHEIPGLATPTPLHAYKCGEIVVAAPATSFTIEQQHPVEYYKMKKVKGTKSQYEPVAIQEQLVLPFTFGLTYRTKLTAAGENPRIRAYARVVYSYQALDKVEEVGFDLPLVTDWIRQETSLSRVVGHARWYSLRIELVDCQGVVQFDRVLARHSGTNFARDFRCHNIASGIDTVDYQLPPSWSALEPVEGAQFGSVYPSDGSL